MNDEKTSLQQLLAEFELGEEAKQFVRSDLGRCIVGFAKQERDEAVEELKKVWPWRKNRISALQAVIARSESFEAWLSELVIKGNTAERLIDEHSHE